MGNGASRRAGAGRVRRATFSAPCWRAAQPGEAATGTVVALSEFFHFDVVDRLFERRDKGVRLSQGILRQLKLRDQHTVFIDNDQPIALFHRPAPI